MARSSIKIIRILRETASRLQNGAPYEWGHMGSCNCGHVAQTITKYNKGDIHRAAMARYGDWTEQLHDYCPQSGLPLDGMIDQMLAAGFTRKDLAHLERLSDQKILSALPSSAKALKHNVRDDVVLYLYTWANLLEIKHFKEELTQKLQQESTQNIAAVLDA